MALVADNIHDKIQLEPADHSEWENERKSAQTGIIESERKKIKALDEFVPCLTRYTSRLRTMQRFARKALQAKTEMVEPNCAGHFIAKKIHQPRSVLPRPDSGGAHGPDEGGRKIRISPRLQIFTPTPPGGFGRPSPFRSPNQAAPFASRCT